MADVQLDGPIEVEENHVWVHHEGSFAALPFPQSGRWRLFIEVTGLGSTLPDVPALDLMRRGTGAHELRISDPTWISARRNGRETRTAHSTPS